MARLRVLGFLLFFRRLSVLSGIFCPFLVPVLLLSLPRFDFLILIPDFLFATISLPIEVNEQVAGRNSLNCLSASVFEDLTLLLFHLFLLLRLRACAAASRVGFRTTRFLPVFFNRNFLRLPVRGEFGRVLIIRSALEGQPQQESRAVD